MPADLGVTADPCPILVYRTLPERIAGQSVSVFGSSPVMTYLRPSCGEFVVQYLGQGLSDSSAWPKKVPLSTVDFETGEILSDTERRSSSRRRTSLRQYCTHNGLGYLVTLTYEREPSVVDQVWKDVKTFVRRVRAVIGAPFAYAVVIERGEVNKRLHVHVCVGRWYVDLSVSDKCLKCAPPKWDWRSRPPEAGTLCLRCAWGLGIVHGPQVKLDGEVRANGDARRAAMYVSKYVSKDLRSDLSEGSGVNQGRNVYRVAMGFQPLVVRVPSRDVGSALVGAVQSLAGPSVGGSELVEVRALHEIVEDWPGRPTWVGFGPLPSLPEVIE